jgi:hypothetical protein
MYNGGNMPTITRCPISEAPLQCTVKCYGKDVQYDTDAGHMISYKLATELYEPTELLPGDSQSPRIYCANDHSPDDWTADETPPNPSPRARRTRTR